MNAAPALALLATIALPGVQGRIDHLSLDAHHSRIWIAALGNNTIEAVDLRTLKRSRTLQGFEEPQGVLYAPKEDLLVVSNAGNGRVDVFQGPRLQPTTRLHFRQDADNLRLDPVTDEILVGYGEGGIAILDGKTAVQRRNIALTAHPEAFQLIPQDRTLYINLPDAGEIDVADPDRMQVVARWKNPDGLSANYAMTVDPAHERLFVAYRKPSVLAVFDAKSGKLLSKLELSADCDDLYLDAARKRVYAICGAGFVDVVDVSTVGHEHRLSKIETASGARTGLFMRETSRLYVAAPARDGIGARLLVYKVRS